MAWHSWLMVGFMVSKNGYINNRLSTSNAFNLADDNVYSFGKNGNMGCYMLLCLLTMGTSAKAVVRHALAQASPKMSWGSFQVGAAMG